MRTIVILLSVGLGIHSASGVESQLGKRVSRVMVNSTNSTVNTASTVKVNNVESVNKCLLNAIKQASPEQTAGDLRRSCAAKAANLVKQRVELEKQASKNPFAIIPHKPNFVLPASITSINQDPYTGTPIDSKLDDVEIKFQISLKYLAMQDLILRTWIYNLHLPLQVGGKPTIVKFQRLFEKQIMNQK
jgi:hypothetical protein